MEEAITKTVEDEAVEVIILLVIKETDEFNTVTKTHTSRYHGQRFKISCLKYWA